jgi:hypothetical protein
MLSVEQITKVALTFSNTLKLQLVETLLASLEGNEAIEKTWLTEAKRRRDEIRQGLVEMIPGDEALAQVRQLLNE